MVIWVTPGWAFFLFVFVFRVANSAATVEIKLQRLTANKIGKFIAIIMNITFYRKKVPIVSQKASNFATKASWIDQK